MGTATDLSLELPRRRVDAAFGAVLLATALVFLDAGALQVALPTVQTDIGASTAGVAFASAVYQLAWGVAVVPVGRMGDLWGRGRLLMYALGGFAFGSALTAVSGSVAMLAAGRAIQGLAASAIAPQAIAYVATRYPPEERAHWFGVVSGTMGAAAVAGPAFGGLLTRTNVLGLGWRLIFLINVPLAALVIAKLVRHRDDFGAGSAAPMDMVGIVLLALGMLCLLLPMTGLGPNPLFLLGPAVVLLAALAVVEVRRSRAEGNALLPPAVVSNRRFVLGGLLYLLLFGAAAGFTLVLALYVQEGVGLTALQASVLVIGSPIGSAIASFNAARIDRRLHGHGLTVGFLMTVASMVALTVTGPLVSTPAQCYWLAPIVALSGAGFGLITPHIVNLTIRDVPASDTGTASGVLSSVQILARAAGVAGFGALLLAGVSASIAGDAAASARLATTSPAAKTCVVSHLHDGDGIGARTDCGASSGREGLVVGDVVRRAFAHGFVIVFAVSSAGFVLAWALGEALRRGGGAGKRAGPPAGRHRRALTAPVKSGATSGGANADA